MQHFVHKLVLVSFLAHMVMGCCSHHAHGCRSAIAPSFAPSACSHEHCNHSHGGSPAEEPRGGGHKGCGGARCEFVCDKSVSPSEIPATWNCVGIDGLVPNDAVPSADKFFSPHPPCPPVPLGLDILNQVMLL